MQREFDPRDHPADVVSDAADTGGTDVGEVFAENRGVHAGGRREFTARRDEHAALGEMPQDVGVCGQPEDSGFRNRGLAVDSHRRLLALPVNLPSG